MTYASYLYELFLSALHLRCLPILIYVVCSFSSLSCLIAPFICASKQWESFYNS